MPLMVPWRNPLNWWTDYFFAHALIMTINIKITLEVTSSENRTDGKPELR